MPWLQPSNVLALVVAGVLWIDVAGRLILASQRAALSVRGAAVMKLLAGLTPVLLSLGFNPFRGLGLPFDELRVLPQLFEASFWALLALAVVQLVRDAPEKKELR